jgi:hypothetical protein
MYDINSTSLCSRKVGYISTRNFLLNKFKFNLFGNYKIKVQLLIYNIIHPKIKSVDLPIYNHLTKGAVGYAHVTKEQ